MVRKCLSARVKKEVGAKSMGERFPGSANSSRSHPGAEGIPVWGAQEGHSESGWPQRVSQTTPNSGGFQEACD